MSEVKNLPVELTEKAIQEFQRLKQSENLDRHLRIGVKGGGCAGYTYILEFDELQDGDTTYDLDGLTILINLHHKLHLNNVKIDFESGLNNRGFSFTNPNAETTCGCGISFG